MDSLCATSLPRSYSALNQWSERLLIIIQIQPILQYKKVYTNRTNLCNAIIRTRIEYIYIYGVDNCMNITMPMHMVYIRTTPRSNLRVHSFRLHSALPGHLLVTMHCYSYICSYMQMHTHIEAVYMSGVYSRFRLYGIRNMPVIVCEIST